MSEKNMTRAKAFGIAEQALDIAQDLRFHAEFKNPKNWKLLYRIFPSRKVYQELEECSEYFSNLSSAAYALYNEISDWAMNVSE